MSWFEAAGLTSLARSALKEAQRTIDKALDIQETGSDSPTAAVPAQESTGVTSAKLKEGTESFFAEFGIGDKKEENKDVTTDPGTDTAVNPTASSPTVASSQPCSSEKLEEKSRDQNESSNDAADGEMAAPPMAASLWGSFTGSFFEQSSSSQKKPVSATSTQPESAAPAFSGSVVATQPHLSPVTPPADSPQNCRLPSLDEVTSIETCSSNYSEVSLDSDKLSKDVISKTPSVEDSLAYSHSRDTPSSLGTDTDFISNNKTKVKTALDALHLTSSSAKESFNSIFSSNSVIPTNQSTGDSVQSSSTDAVSAPDLTGAIPSTHTEEGDWGWGWESGAMMLSSEADKIIQHGRAADVAPGSLADEPEDKDGFSSSKLIVSSDFEASQAGSDTSPSTGSDNIERSSDESQKPSDVGLGTTCRNKLDVHHSLIKPMEVTAEEGASASSSIDSTARRKSLNKSALNLQSSDDHSRKESHVQNPNHQSPEINDGSNKNSDANSGDASHNTHDNSEHKSKLSLNLVSQLTETATPQSGVPDDSIPSSSSSKTSNSSSSSAALPVSSSSCSERQLTSPAVCSVSSTTSPSSSESFAVISSPTSPSLEVRSESSSEDTSRTDTSLTDTSTQQDTLLWTEDGPVTTLSDPPSSSVPSQLNQENTDARVTDSRVAKGEAWRNSPDGTQTLKSSHFPPLSVSTISNSSSSRTELPLTVQPSKSPLKIATMTTVIDSQITSSDHQRNSCAGGDKWGSSSAEDEEESDRRGSTGSSRSPVLEETPVESLTTITRQPLAARVLGGTPLEVTASTVVSSADSQKWDSFSEDVSASESMHSTSSSHTVVEGGLGGALSVSQEMEDAAASSKGRPGGGAVNEDLDSCWLRGEDESRTATDSAVDSSGDVTDEAMKSKRDDCLQLSERFISKQLVSEGNPVTPHVNSDTDQSSDLCKREVRDLELAATLPLQSTECDHPSLGESLLLVPPDSSPSIQASTSTALLTSSSAAAPAGVFPCESGPAPGISSTLESGLPCVPLDVSVESGGSSDTITASMESCHLLEGSCVEGLQDRLEGDLGERRDHVSDEVASGASVTDIVPSAASTNISSQRRSSNTSDSSSWKNDVDVDGVADEEHLPALLLEAMGEEQPTEQAMEQLAKTGVQLAKGVVQAADGAEKNASPAVTALDDVRQAATKVFVETERENSPSSSDSLNSEMVKVGGSEHTSCHTSGDEFETTTSSDIEVISSPSLDGVSVYGYTNHQHQQLGGPGGGALLGPAQNTASRVWNSLRLKSFLVEPSVGGSKGPNGTAPQDRADAAISPSMTASFTSISESDGGGVEMWGGSSVGGSSSPPHSKQRRSNDGAHHYFERGHTRNQSNMSETSESSSEPHTPELEKLSKKVSQLSDVLEARELRVLELSQQNAGLQDANHVLQQRVQELEGGGGEGAEALREEFTQRLATMEKKFQQALRDKEAATKQLEALRTESATRLSSSEVRLQLEERDQTIVELRTEGEKLSKQQLHYSNTIKKLRAKEKELEATVAQQSAKISSQMTEIDRQHKQLLAKSEVERRQACAVTQLTGALQQAEDQLKEARAEGAETEGKMVVLREALEAAYKEVGDAKRQESARAAALAEQSLSAEVGAKQQLQEALQQLQKQAEREKQALLLQVEEMQEERDRMQQQADRTERQCRAELHALQQQLSEAEGRGEQMSSAVAAATRPLLRQLENLQSSHAQHRQAWEELEAQLSHRLQEAEKSAAVSTERERSIREQSAQALSQKAALQAQAESVKVENSALAAKVQSLTAAISKLEAEKLSLSREVGEVRSSLTRELTSARANSESLRVALELERTAVSAERKRNEALQRHISDTDHSKVAGGTAAGGGSAGGAEGGGSCNVSRQSSPTPSLSRLSLAGSVNSLMANNWADDVFESGSAVWGGGGSVRGGGAGPSLYEALRGNTATTVEALTSQLSQREGEVHHLHGEVTRHEAQRESLATELLQVTDQMDKMQQQLQEMQQLKDQHADTTQKYNALLQMYGEKVEEVEELRLDLADVKEMYKAQINQLMQK